MLRNHSRRSPASRIFDHLSEEERIDKACELLAIGVMRLAEKRGLLKGQKTSSPENPDESKKAA